jgi:hypothetical protein
MGDPRAHPASPGRPLGRPGPLPTTSHDDDHVQVDPPRAQHGLSPASSARPQPRQTTRRHGHGGRPRQPRPTQPCGGRPHRHTPRPHAVGHRGRRNARTPAAGHWTPGRSDAAPDTGHVDTHRWTPDACTGHWTPDAGHERGHGDDSTAGIRTSWAATPSDHTLRPQPCLCSRTTSRLLGHLAGQAAPRRIALLGKWFGVRVARDGGRHPLW